MECMYCKGDEELLTVIGLDNKYFYICKDCYLNNFDGSLKCSCCGKHLNYTTDNNILRYNNSVINNRGILCENCCTRFNSEETYVNNFEYVPNNLRDYSFKPNPIKFKKLKEEDKNNFYFGIELEVGGLRSYSSVQNFCNKHGGSIFYFKRDASIREYGCEIVTYPATLKYHLSDYSNWRYLFEDINSCGFKSGVITNTGVHIHVNRSNLSDDQIKKTDLFVNKYQNLFEKLSGRQNNHYAEYHNKPIANWGVPNSNRYSSINFQNSHTVEFRIFNGTTKINELFSYIELVHAIINFVSTTTYESLYEDDNLLISNFKKYIFDKDLYKELKEFIINNHI